MIDTYTIDSFKRVVFRKDPGERLDYSVDFASALGTATIAEYSQPTVDSESGAVLDTPTLTGTVFTVWVSGGTLGEMAAVTFSVTASNGKKIVRTIYLQLVTRSAS